MSQEHLKKVGGELVPTWAGNPDKFEEYHIRAQIYVNGAERWKQPQRVSNLIQALEGAAWQIILHISDRERENLQKNFEDFIRFLKEHCQETEVPELGRRFREWQKFRRTKGESMRVFCRRCRTQLGKLENSMNLVENPKGMLRN